MEGEGRGRKEGGGRRGSSASLPPSTLSLDDPLFLRTGMDVVVNVSMLVMEDGGRREGRKGGRKKGEEGTAGRKEKENFLNISELPECKDELENLFQIISSRAKLFDTPCLSSWMEWMTRAHVDPKNILRPGLRVFVDLEKSEGFQVAPDGVQLRHDANFEFSSAIASHSVTTGNFLLLLPRWKQALLSCRSLLLTPQVNGTAARASTPLPPSFPSSSLLLTPQVNGTMRSSLAATRACTRLAGLPLNL
jgi:hypothetical protein